MLTAEVYGHLDLEDMREGLNRLTFTSSTAPEISAEVVQLVANSSRHGAPVVWHSEASGSSTSSRVENLNDSSELHQWALQDSNLQPSGYEPLKPASAGLAPLRTGSLSLGKREVGDGQVARSVGRISTVSILRGAPVVRNLVRMLRVREVAALLSVCTATVYAMLDRGELERVWLGNSIRVTAKSLDALIAKGSR